VAAGATPDGVPVSACAGLAAGRAGVGWRTVAASSAGEDTGAEGADPSGRAADSFTSLVTDPAAGEVLTVGRLESSVPDPALGRSAPPAAETGRNTWSD
jgi:hypothetical protein